MQRRTIPPYTNILVPTDGSRLSAKAVAHGIALAQALGARVTAFYASPQYPMPGYTDGVVYHPMSPQEYGELCDKAAARIFKPVEARARDARIDFASVHAVGGAPWEAILTAARKQKCDAIVMASHGRRGVSALLLGSETQKVLTHSKLPVIVVR